MPAASGLLTHDALRPGARLGRHELLVPIATGGMARVWAARLHGQRGFSKIVAIKTILPHLARVAEFERMFLDEARIAAGVHHPNVCEIYELGEEGSVLYLAMEWVNGDALTNVLRSGQKEKETPLDPRIAARVLADAAAGVHAAHNLTDDMGSALNVVHRDISPHNILISADGNVKVTDFGVAKALGQIHDSTSRGQLRGKLGYMPPEQVAGGYVDRRSDVFALGCVLYQCITGRPPFLGEVEAQLLAAVNKGEFPRPRDLVRGLPDELEGIILRAMARDPLQRFPSAERLRMALEEFLAKSGPVVTQTQVGVVVQQRLGPLLDKRKEKIRAAQATPDADAPPPSSSSSSSSGVLPAPSPLALSSYSDPPPPVSSIPSVTSSSSGVQSIAPPPVITPAPASDARKIMLAAGLGILAAIVIGAIAIGIMAKGDPPKTTSSPVKTQSVVTATTTTTTTATTTAAPPIEELTDTPAASAAPSATATETTSTKKVLPALPANPY